MTNSRTHFSCALIAGAICLAAPSLGRAVFVESPARDATPVTPATPATPAFGSLAQAVDNADANSRPAVERIPVFIDAITADWQFTQWSDTQFALIDDGGNKKIDVRYTKAWAGFTIDHRSTGGQSKPFDADQLAAVVFDIEGDATSLAAIAVTLDNGSARQKIEKWRKGKTVRIPMTVLNDARAPVVRLAFMNASRSGEKRIVLDNIYYERAARVVRSAAELAPRPLRVSIEPSATFAISPYIYGDNEHEGIEGLRFARLGGNRWSTYNYTNNASNSGIDWGPHHNDGYLSSSSEPAAPVIQFVRASHRKGAAALVTVPMLDWVAADKRGRVTAAAGPTNGRFASSSADSDTTALRQDRLVALVEAQRRDATVFWSLDNEPGLWPSTHPLVHPSATTYAEMAERSTRYARMVKRVAPSSLVFFSVAYGFAEFVNLQQATDGRGRDYLEFLLDEMQRAEREHGKRLGDVLDVHWYPELRAGSGRITASQRHDPPDDEVDARVQAPRSLWDASYDEKTWITKFKGGPVQLLPWLKDKIARRYPGTKLAITEYNYGGGEHISGAIAQADVLGIFGREGVFAANLWAHHFQKHGSYVHTAFRMFLDVDGAGTPVGDTGLTARVDDVVGASAYAFVDAVGRRQLVLLNKGRAPRVVTIAWPGMLAETTFTTRVLTDQAKLPQRSADVRATDGEIAITLAPLSVVTFAEAHTR
jgi:hypothetical protein